MRWEEIKQTIEGTLLQDPDTNAKKDVQHLLTDSRLLKSAADTIFFALKGKQDGHEFIKQLYRLGVRFFVVGYPIDTKNLVQASFLQVPNTVHALQSMARRHREKVGLQTIGITGSNGKTTVKEWLSSMLSTEKSVVKTPKSYNSQIGVPLSVWNIHEKHQIGVFEAGISQKGEMQKLAEIIAPDVGIFTSIGPAHAGGFEDEAEKIEEKIKLFQYSEKVICRREHKDVFKQLQKLFKGQIVDWSTSSPEAQIAVSITDHQVNLSGKNYQHSFRIPFDFSIWTENCIHAIIAALEFQISPENIQRAIDDLQPIKMRLSIKKGRWNSYIIDDSYNNDLYGLEVALDYLKRQNQREKKTVILSQMVDPALSESELAFKLKGLVGANDVSRVFLIGRWTEELFLDWSVEVALYPSKESFLRNLPPFQSEMILVKGARNYRFEEIANRLEEKSHGTRLEINFESVIHNLNAYRQQLQSNVKLLAMVKAFGYGGGGAEISNLLQFHNVDYLGVAYTDEAVQLRDNGLTLPILVLNPDFDRLEEMHRLSIEPEVYSLLSLQKILQEESVPAIHLKIETGMNRLGFTEEEWAPLSQKLRENPQVRVAGIFTHLSSAEDQEADLFSQQQVDQFEKAYQLISDSLGYAPLKHAVNSAGIVRHPDYHFDMVRLGIGLYGYDPSHKLDLRQVGRLTTTVSQVKKVSKGDAIGYSRAGKTDHDMDIAILPIGYADGYDRRFGKGVGHVIWKGHRLPSIGNICMDMTMIKTLGHPVKEGDEVEIFGTSQSISEIASDIGTIPYEILTSISQRVVRIFQSE